MIYRVPESWIEGRRRAARWVAPLLVVLGVVILALALVPRVNWRVPQERHAALFVSLVVVVGLLLGGLAGRFTFRNTMKNWQTFSVELTPNELIRQLNGQEVRIERANVASIREFPARGFVVQDNLGWRIFVPKMVENYEDFKQRIVAWGIKT